MNNTIDETRKITNKTLAMSNAEPEIFVKPNIAATMEITKNVAAHDNISLLLFEGLPRSGSLNQHI